MLQFHSLSKSICFSISCHFFPLIFDVVNQHLLQVTTFFSLCLFRLFIYLFIYYLFLLSGKSRPLIYSCSCCSYGSSIVVCDNHFWFFTYIVFNNILISSVRRMLDIDQFFLWWFLLTVPEMILISQVKHRQILSENRYIHHLF